MAFVKNKSSNSSASQSQSGSKMALSTTTTNTNQTDSILTSVPPPATTATTQQQRQRRRRFLSFCNASCAATLFMTLYISFAVYNLTLLMFPLRMLDLSTLRSNPHEWVHPLWTTGSPTTTTSTTLSTVSSMHLRVYLSTHARFSLQILASSNDNDDDDSNDESHSTASSSSSHHVLLWDQELNRPALSKTFLLTTPPPPQPQTDGSNTGSTATTNQHQQQHQQSSAHTFAVDWLDRTEQQHPTNITSNLWSTLSAASGHGVESTSLLWTLYQNGIATPVRSLLRWLRYYSQNTATTHQPADNHRTTTTDDTGNGGFVGRTTVFIPNQSPLWTALHSNSTVYLHALVVRTTNDDTNTNTSWPPRSTRALQDAVQTAARTHALLLGTVNLIQYEVPTHAAKPRRALGRDVLYFWNRWCSFCFGHVQVDSQHGQQQADDNTNDNERPPWDMATAKPEEHAAYQHGVDLRRLGQKYPYWKPEVSIKFVSDTDSYPVDYAHLSGMPLVQVVPNTNQNNNKKDNDDQSSSRLRQAHPTGYAFTPALHVDEMGMTSEKYIPMNETVTSLPLRISFDRSDMTQTTTTTTATAGGMSPARWRLLKQLSGAIDKQKGMGFDDADIDDIKRLIADTNLTLLSITMLASALHLLFEFLTFKSEVSFWKNNNDLTGLSVRSLFLDCIGQMIILFYLIEKESSLLTTVPCAIGCAIAFWKGQRAAGLKFVKVAANRTDSSTGWGQYLIRALTGHELRATRLEAWSLKTSQADDDDKGNVTQSARKERLIAMTMEADRLATRYLGAVLVPLASGYTLYSLICHEHRSWYSWLITSAASAVYALGFILMTPQLFLNWKMKSVAHLPWRVLVYKSLNTFIDDLFSFIIRMPTMARISCFRDDVVFFIYIYQRWLYPVDVSRPVEGGGEAELLIDNREPQQNTSETKKIQ